MQLKITGAKKMQINTIFHCSLNYFCFESLKFFLSMQILSSFPFAYNSNAIPSCALLDDYILE